MGAGLSLDKLLSAPKFPFSRQLDPAHAAPSQAAVSILARLMHLTLCYITLENKMEHASDQTTLRTLSQEQRQSVDDQSGFGAYRGHYRAFLLQRVGPGQREIQFFRRTVRANNYGSRPRL